MLHTTRVLAVVLSFAALAVACPPPPPSATDSPCGDPGYTNCGLCTANVDCVWCGSNDTCVAADDENACAGTTYATSNLCPSIGAPPPDDTSGGDEEPASDEDDTPEEP